MNETPRQKLVSLVAARVNLQELRGGERAVVNQRPFLLAVGFACIISLLFFPVVFTKPLFVTGLALTIVSVIPAVVMSWRRNKALLYWLTPLLQFIAIAALRAGGGDSLVGLTLIAVFPVIWIAWFAQTRVIAHVVNFLAALTIVWIPVLLQPGSATLHSLAAPLVVPIMLWAVGLFAAYMSRSIRANERMLLKKDRELRATALESERRAQLLDAVIETVPAGVVVVDESGNDLMMNNQQRIHHRIAVPNDVADPREDQLLVFGSDRVTPLPADQRPVRRAIDGASFQHQLVWLGESERQRAFSVSANQILNSKNDCVGSVIVFNDVTELVDALEAKDEFLHGVSHELRTPLTSVLGYVELAIDEADTFQEAAALSANLRVIERNATRLLQLVSDLLSTASRPALKPRHSDFGEVIRSSIASARPHATAAEVTLIDDSASPLMGYFDPDRMHQVLDNLISNAIKYSSTGDSVTVLGTSSDEALTIRVIDTGRGITEEEQEQVFEKFFRTKDVRESTIPGLGLGLSIVKKIVDAHQGSIRIEQAPVRGTAVTVCIPAPEREMSFM